jgi:hypothetical protein
VRWLRALVAVLVAGINELMRQTHKHAWRLMAVVALTLLLTVMAAVSATAQAPGPPINDNYLASLNLNQPHTALNRVDTLTDVRDTSTATIQSDIFNPPQSGGPAEVTGCNGVSEGRTIWYDLYPDANGIVRIRTSAAFGTVMAVMPFDPTSLLPEIAQRKCAVNQTSQAQELFAEVKAGGSYTVQIGGVNNAGGTVESLFDYVVSPKRLQAETTLTAQPLANGVRIVNLSVSAPKKARVVVRCTRGCGTQAKTARTVGFPKLSGTVLQSGAALKIYVTAKNTTGAYIEYKIHHGSFTKLQRCLAPGGVKPVQCE